jgi:hypothetical protein
MKGGVFWSRENKTGKKGRKNGSLGLDLKNKN